MSRIRTENFRPIEPCDKCPAFNGMESVAVTRTLNPSMPVGEFVIASSYPDRVFYAHDPKNPLAGNVVLGPDIGCVDPFCQGHESASSRTLGETHRACENCSGPKEVSVGFIKKRTVTVCGAGFEKDKGLVSRLNLIAKRQGRSALSSIDTVLPASNRT